jgi:hypothetical protein
MGNNSSRAKGDEVVVVARILGITGGVFGIIFGALGMTIGGAGVAFGSDKLAVVTAVSVVAMVLAMAGIAGAILVDKNAMMSGLLMLIPGAAGFACITIFWILPGILLIVGGVIAFIARGRESEDINFTALSLEDAETSSGPSQYARGWRQASVSLGFWLRQLIASLGSWARDSASHRSANVTG